MTDFLKHITGSFATMEFAAQPQHLRRKNKTINNIC